MIKFNLFTRFGYIWYVCPVTGEEKKTVFVAHPDRRPAKKSAEMQKVRHFVKYGLDEALAVALMAFMVAGHEVQTFVES